MLLISSGIEPATSVPKPTPPPHADERVEAVNKFGSNKEMISLLAKITLEYVEGNNSDVFN